jgi:hypothetical protein
MTEILSDDEMLRAISPELYLHIEGAERAARLADARAVERAVAERLQLRAVFEKIAATGGELPEPVMREPWADTIIKWYNADQMHAQYAQGVAAGMAQAAPSAEPSADPSFVRSARDALTCMREYSSEADEDCGDAGCERKDATTTLTLPPLPEPEDYVSTRSGAVGTYTAEHMRAHGLAVAVAVREACTEHGTEAEYSSADAIRAKIMAVKIEGEAR